MIKAQSYNMATMQQFYYQAQDANIVSLRHYHIMNRNKPFCYVLKCKHIMSRMKPFNKGDTIILCLVWTHSTIKILSYYGCYESILWLRHTHNMARMKPLHDYD